jgi:hypothetical protein
MNEPQSSALLNVIADTFATFSSSDLKELIFEPYAALVSEMKLEALAADS